MALSAVQHQERHNLNLTLCTRLTELRGILTKFQELTLQLNSDMTHAWSNRLPGVANAVRAAHDASRPLSARVEGDVRGMLAQLDSVIESVRCSPNVDTRPGSGAFPADVSP